MRIDEQLNKPENIRKFRELAKKHHPDVGGSPDIMRKINNAKDDGDTAFEKLVRDLFPEYNRVDNSELKKKMLMLDRELDGFVPNGNVIVNYIPSKKEIEITVKIVQKGFMRTYFIFNAETKTLDEIKEEIVNKLKKHI